MAKARGRVTRVSDEFYNTGMKLAKKNNTTFLEITRDIEETIRQMNGKKKKRRLIREIEF